MDAAMREVLASGGCAAGGGAAKGAVSQLADQILGPRPMCVNLACTIRSQKILNIISTQQDGTWSSGDE